jgi:thiamine pyrophosphate-dependent acetolactate synthase large subunit-like protein
VDALKLNGVTTIYGVAGIPITDLARIAQRSGIRYIGFRQESVAGHAAAIAGYLTQKPGICLTVSAPGFLNGMVALANATTNCFHMIQISGSSDRAIVDLQRGEIKIGLVEFLFQNETNPKETRLMQPVSRHNLFHFEMRWIGKKGSRKLRFRRNLTNLSNS